ncbi:MAG: Na+/H+ antiporter NhaC family protein [Planctomycetes bacterium]|nr:Na+/H+ antiporter NhaC family protein [Planctomycetota bacterium]
MFPVAAALLLSLAQEEPQRLELHADRPVLLEGVPFTLTILTDRAFTGEADLDGLRRKGNPLPRVMVWNGVGIADQVTADGPVTVRIKDRSATLNRRVLPAWLCLVPPLLCIVLAFTTRQVILSLAFGVAAGAALVAGFGAADLLRSPVLALDTVVGEVSQPQHALILTTLLLVGGLIGIMAYSGGMRGFVDRFAGFLRTRRSGMVATWGLCLGLFFDDYANSLIAGNTMRSLTDRLRISREKLAYLVDSTAGPITALGLVSTWIFLEEKTLLASGIADPAEILRLVPYGFYTLFAIAFVFLIAATSRDFGPMYAAEVRAITTGQLLRLGARPMVDREIADVTHVENLRERWHNVLVPVAVLVGLTLVSLIVTGMRNPSRPAAAAGVLQILQYARPFRAFLWGTAGATVVAAVLVLARRHLELPQLFEGWLRGMRSMLVAAVLLVLAWSMGQMCRDLSVGRYLAAHLPGASMTPWLPAAAFLVCAATSVAVGSAWSTLALLLPVLAPLATGQPDGIQLGVLAAVLSGSLFGDHVSPISDTTIISSLGSACDHIDHVRTQGPYAVAVAAVATAFGFVPVGFGVSPYLCLPLGVAALAGVVFLLGKRLPRGAEEE